MLFEKYPLRDCRNSTNHAPATKVSARQWARMREICVGWARYEDLLSIKKLFDDGVLTQEEFEIENRKLLDE